MYIQMNEAFCPISNDQCHEECAFRETSDNTCRLSECAGGLTMIAEMLLDRNSLARTILETKTEMTRLDKLMKKAIEKKRDEEKKLLKRMKVDPSIYENMTEKEREEVLAVWNERWDTKFRTIPEILRFVDW